MQTRVFPFEADRADDVLTVVITAKGESVMTSTPETGTAAAATAEERKAAKKARAGARGAHVAPAKDERSSGRDVSGTTLRRARKQCGMVRSETLRGTHHWVLRHLVPGYQHVKRAGSNTPVHNFHPLPSPGLPRWLPCCAKPFASVSGPVTVSLCCIDSFATAAFGHEREKLARVVHHDLVQHLIARTGCFQFRHKHR